MVIMPAQRISSHPSALNLYGLFMYNIWHYNSCTSRSRNRLTAWTCIVKKPLYLQIHLCINSGQNYHHNVYDLIVLFIYGYLTTFTNQLHSFSLHAKNHIIFSFKKKRTIFTTRAETRIISSLDGWPSQSDKRNELIISLRYSTLMGN